MRSHTLFEAVGFIILTSSLYFLIAGAVGFSLSLMFAGYVILAANDIIKNIKGNW